MTHPKHTPVDIAYKLDGRQRTLLAKVGDGVPRTAGDMAEFLGGVRIHQSLIKLGYLERDNPDSWPPKWVITDGGSRALEFLRAAG